MVSRAARARAGNLPALALTLVVVFVLGVVFVFAQAGCASAPARASAPPRSVGDGVYTMRQASLGRRRFEQTCQACHRPREFRGSAFQAAWRGRTVGDLLQVLLDTMPPDDPGGLDPEYYADVVAYFLSLNGYPSGEEDLPADPRALGEVRF